MISRVVLFTVFIFLLAQTASSQVGIGTTSPDPSALLHLESNSQGFLNPRMNITERDAIVNPAPGLIIYNTNTNCTEIFIGGVWFNVCSGGKSPDMIDTDVFNPYTGQIFMDRNLGANRAATSLTDVEAYGDLYQWGRAAEGHEKIFRVAGDAPTSSTYSQNLPKPTSATASGAWDGSFIRVTNVAPADWLDPQDDNLWQGLNGVNNPCPTGYRVPTEAEWQLEIDSWASLTPESGYLSILKLTLPGRRKLSDGSLQKHGVIGYYWTSTLDGVQSKIIRLKNNDFTVVILPENRARALSVRCIKN